MKKDVFKIANIKLKSRLIVGTGKYKDFKETARAVEASKADMVTVAVRRVNIIDKKKPILTNFQICLLLGFLITLLPIIPNGNFFNNWLSMIMFFPIGFYIFSLKKVKK